MKELLIFIFISFLFSSCAFHQGNFTSQNALSNNRGTVKGYAVGISSVNYFLGIGGLKKNALFFEAKKNLIQSYPLEKGQIFANFTTDYTFRNLILIQKAKVIVTADIIQTSDTGQAYSNEYLQSLSFETNKKPFFAIGDSVQVLSSNNLLTGKIISIKGQKLSLLLPSTTEVFKTSTFDQANCYKKTYPEIEAKYEIKAGDKIKYQIKNEKEVSTYEAVVWLLNPVALLVKTDGKYKVIGYDQILKK